MEAFPPRSNIENANTCPIAQIPSFAAAVRARRAAKEERRQNSCRAMPERITIERSASPRLDETPTMKATSAKTHPTTPPPARTIPLACRVTLRHSASSRGATAIVYGCITPALNTARALNQPRMASENAPKTAGPNSLARRTVGTKFVPEESTWSTSAHVPCRRRLEVKRHPEREVGTPSAGRAHVVLTRPKASADDGERLP